MATQEITAIILTKSAKHHNYCVAGINCETGKFVRFVSEDISTDGALTRRDVMYANMGFSAKPLHMVKVKVKQHLPGKFQTENYLIDRSCRWVFVRCAGLDEALFLHPPETHKKLFGGYREFSFTNEMLLINYSLVLIEAEKLKLHTDDGKTKADFVYNAANYRNFPVTDMDFFDLRQGYYPKAYLVLSIAEKPIQINVHYKFIAKIFIP